MTKTIEIDGRKVPFRATAAIPRLYRILFRRDIMQDMRELQGALEAAQAGEGDIPPRLLEVFENVAFLMARHAEPTMPETTVEEWLDGFDTFSIYVVLPELMELWRANNECLVEPKKKRGPLTGS